MRRLPVQIGPNYYELALNVPHLAVEVFEKQLMDGHLTKVRFPLEKAQPLSTYIDVLRKEGFEHLTLRIPKQDYEKHQAALHPVVGEPLVTMGKYIYTRGDYKYLRPIKELCPVRPYEETVSRDGILADKQIEVAMMEFDRA